MNARKALAGIAKYSAVGVALSLGDPLTALAPMALGVGILDV